MSVKKVIDKWIDEVIDLEQDLEWLNCHHEKQVSFWKRRAEERQRAIDELTAQVWHYFGQT